jgi:hypothetical protein
MQNNIQSTKYLKYMYGLFSLAYISIALKSPVTLYLNAVHDDGLFINNGFSIVSTGWLPEYNQYVLSKGSGLPIFLALNSILGLPITLSLALVFILSAFALSQTLNRCGISPLWGFAAFALLLTNFALIPTRIVRDNLYATLTIFAVVLALELFVVPKERPIGRMAIFILGSSLGLFFLTREEFIWIVPFFIFLILQFIWSNRETWSKFSIWKPTLIALLGFVLPVVGVTILNYSHYGVWQTNDFSQGSFSVALSRLQGVNPQEGLTPFLPVPKSVREQIYSVSPKFEELRQELEVNLTDSWTGEATPGCQLYPQTCGDYSGGWFAWALRDAVANTGYYANATEAEDFYRELVKEIDSACANKSLDCELPVTSLVPRITQDTIHRIITSLQKAVVFTLDQNSTFEPQPSTGSPDKTMSLSKFLGSPNSTAPETLPPIWVSGWYGNQGWIKTICNKDGAEIEIILLPSPDLVIALDDEKLSSARFSVNVAGLLDCHLVQQTDDGQILSLWGDIVSNGFQLNNGWIESIESPSNSVSPDSMRDFKIFVTDMQNLVVKFLFPLAIISNLMLMLALIWKHQIWHKVRAPTLVFWAISILFFSRIILISLINGTSFPAINGSYLGPAIAVVPLLCLLPLLSGCSITIEWWKAKNKTPS